MTAMGIPANAKQLAALVKEGERPTLEFKRSTGERHDSKPVNPLIAGSFHRTGAVEVWGRGTNRVITMCRKHGAPPPRFEERQDFLIVTFRARLVAEDTAAVSGVQSGAQSIRLLGALSQSTLSARALAEALGMRSKTGALKRTLGEMVAEGLIAYTRPDKPSSRLQKYRLTPAGEKALKERGGGT